MGEILIDYHSCLIIHSPCLKDTLCLPTDSYYIYQSYGMLIIVLSVNNIDVS